MTDRRAVATALIEEAFNEQRFHNVESLLTAYTLHVGDDTLHLGPGDLERLVANWHAGFSDFHFDVHHVIVDGDLAAVHATLHGLHDGTWNGKPPTGKVHTVRHMFVIRFDEGQIVEVWELNDPAGLP